jgi:competence protein ComEA
MVPTSREFAGLGWVIVLLLLAVLWHLSASKAPPVVLATAPKPESVASAAPTPLVGLIDLNLADSATLTRLPGVSPLLARRIVRYRTAAGGFRSWAHVERVWGLAALLPSLRPYMVLSPAPRTYTPVDLNLADSAALEALPGIGPAFARRIVAYRSKLGFYRSAMQVREVYGMSDSLYRIAEPYLLIGDLTDAEQLNVNAMSEAELARHPYIGFTWARRIVRYREQHGPFAQPRHLARIYGLDSARLARLLPYLRAE